MGVGVAVMVSDTLWWVLDSCSWNSLGTMKPLACCGHFLQALILNLEPWLSGLMTLENPYFTFFIKAVYCHPAYLTYMQSTSWAGLEEAQAGIKIAVRNIKNLRYADDTTLMAESEEELKSLLMKVKEESEKVGLRLSIQKTKIMASGPITSWEIGKQWKQWQTWFWGAPKSL